MTQATVAILGNPNCGKTTLFNRLTGARQHIGNWPGVTVEKKSGFYTGAAGGITLVDLPGTYSLDVGIGHTALDEKIARDYVLADDADLYINIIDASNIERNLYLTTQLLEMNRPMLVVLNMIDVALEKQIVIDTAELGKRLGCPVISMSASQNQGIQKLREAIDQQLASDKNQTLVTVTYPEVVENALSNLSNEVQELAQHWNVSPRWVAGRLLEGDQTLQVQCTKSCMEIVCTVRAALQQEGGEEVDILFADGRYQFIESLTDDVVRREQKLSQSMTQKIDKVVLSRWFGLPIFFAVMYLMFMFTINVGSAFIDFFDILAGTIFVDGTRHLLENYDAPGLLTIIVADGIGGGIQTVATFIPVIGCLFLFLSLLEDSGYMARAAFVMDRGMRAFGLPGKAFLPILVGFGCNVPAIMATRTLDQERDRKLTIMMNPFMSCGARLPVYALFAVVFFPGTGQNVVFSLYLVGILVAIFTGLIMKNTLLWGRTAPFVMELPRYHVPNLQSILLNTWDRLKSFIVKAGKTIVMMVMILGVLNSVGTDGTFGNENTEKSVLSTVGRTITPIFAPMGMHEDNWPAAVGIFTGMFAKEAVVGTMDALYSNMSRAEDKEQEYDFLAGLATALATIPENFSNLGDTFTDPLGIGVGTTNDVVAAAREQGVYIQTYDTMRLSFGSEAAAYAYLLFILLYIPCVAAMGAVRREAGRRWMWLVGGWSTFMAYVVSTLYYQIATFADHPYRAAFWSLIMVVSLVLVFFWLRHLGQRERAGKVASVTLARVSNAQ